MEFEQVLSVNDLTTYFLADCGIVRAVDGVSFYVNAVARYRARVHPLADACSGPDVP